MMYLVLIFISPVYFVARRKWGGFILNAILYGLALLCAITIVGLVVAPLFWILAVGHAAWHLRKEVMEEHATMIATKMAQQMAMAGSVSHSESRPT